MQTKWKYDHKSNNQRAAVLEEKGVLFTSSVDINSEQQTNVIETFLCTDYRII